MGLKHAIIIEDYDNEIFIATSISKVILMRKWDVNGFKIKLRNFLNFLEFLIYIWQIKFSTSIFQWCKFRNKNCFNIFWVVVVKNLHGTLISKCMKEPGWFLACCTYLTETKVTLIVIGWSWWNMGCPFRSWESIICCISRMN